MLVGKIILYIYYCQHWAEDSRKSMTLSDGKILIVWLNRVVCVFMNFASLSSGIPWLSPSYSICAGCFAAVPTSEAKRPSNTVIVPLIFDGRYSWLIHYPLVWASVTTFGGRPSSSFFFINLIRRRLSRRRPWSQLIHKNVAVNSKKHSLLTKVVAYPVWSNLWKSKSQIASVQVCPYGTLG